jgi:prepilin-type N-terminal cleavage/methylation domain-containing protein
MPLPLRTRAARPSPPVRPGFTLIELMISLSIGVVVLAIGTSFALGTWRSQRRAKAHDTLARDARFVAMSLTRDVQDAGIAFESTQDFGSLAARGDTVLTLSVPFDPSEAPTYDMATPNPALADPLPAGGECGADCLRFTKDANGFRIRPGDVARLQVAAQRRLVLVTDVTDNGATVDVRIATGPTLFVFPAAFSGSLAIPHSGVTIQRLVVTGWFRDAATRQLMRVEGFAPDGSLRASAVAGGVEQFQARLLFTDGTERAMADGVNADTLDDYDRITSLLVRARMRTDSAGAGMPSVVRRHEWRITPRNLMYERNRQL